MNRKDWMQWRKGGIGGSDAGAVLKRFPFGKTPLMVYREKIDETDNNWSNVATIHGKENEEAALQWFEKKMACSLFRQVKIEHPDIPWIRATLDGIDGFDKYLVEVKCPFNLENHEVVKASMKVPEIYYPQCQHQLKCKELDGMYFESFNSKDPADSVIIEVTRDEKFIEEMLPEYEKFWHCVKNRIPPEMTEYDFFFMEDESWNYAADKFREADEWVEKRDYWRNELIKLSEGRNCQGGGVSVKQSECKGFIDYEKIPQLIGVDLEPYRKPKFTKTSVRPIIK
jgi:putative phage-type endonuclease